MFTNFAGWPIDLSSGTIPDPADSLVHTASTGTAANRGLAWGRAYMTYYPSLDAKYIAPAFRVREPWEGNASEESAVYLAKMMVEQVGVSRSTPSSKYSKAREIQVIVRADRINLAINPRQNAGTSEGASWVSTTGVALTGHPLGFTTGTQNAITAGAAGTIQTFASVVNFDGVGTTAPAPRRLGLWVRTNRIANVTLAMDGSPEHTTTVQVPADTWTWVSTTGYATGQSRVWATTTSGFAANGDSMLFAGALSEPTKSDRTEYFDGGSGEDYLWEEGKSQTTGRSFYYVRRVERSEAMQRALKDAAPLGVGIGTPRFGVWST